MPDLTDINPEELRGFAPQVGRAANDLSVLQGYATGTCATVDGLRGLLSVFRSPVELTAEANGTVLGKTNDSLWETKHAIRDAADDAESTDADAAQRVGGLFPGAPVFFPEYAGGGTRYGYEDAGDPAPQPPESSVDEITADGIDPGGIVGIVDAVWEMATGESLVSTIIEPIVGKPGRLEWLSQAYKELSDATYQVAWNLRSGTMNVAPHWNGDSGRAFEMHMFRWHMGLGGLGDAQLLVSGVLHDAYEFITTAVDAVVTLIGELLENLAVYATKRFAPGWAWVATTIDVVTGDLWRDIERFVGAWEFIKEKIGELRDACEDFVADIVAAREAVELILDGVSDGDITGTLQDLVDYAQELTYNIEHDRDWDPTAGAARITLLPV